MSNDFARKMQAATSSRRLFLTRSTALTLAGGSAAVLSGALGRAVRADTVPEGFYINAGAQRGSFEAIRGHENDHVEFLVKALGKYARPKPTFKGLEQQHFYDFANVAQALENTGVGAYLGAAPAIDNPEYLAAAGSIMTIEARHASYLNIIHGDPITGSIIDLDSNPPFEASLTAAQVVAHARPFIADLNGGPPVTYSTKPSADNDVAILNFALALEYLEAEFYNVNVAKFY